MSKRFGSEASGQNGSLKGGQRPPDTIGGNANDDVNFEDDYEDEFESEEEFIDASEDDVLEDEVEAEKLSEKIEQMTFIPGRNKLSPGEVLSPDLTAYEMLHELSAKWSCLSFDVIPDQLGEGRARKAWPATIYAVSGTQAPRGKEKENEIMVMKLSNLSKMDRPDDDDSDANEDEDGDENFDPILESRTIKTKSCTNRIRSHQIPKSSTAQPLNTVTGAMMESGQVLIHDITPHLATFDIPGAMVAAEQAEACHVVQEHGRVEGYALDWATGTSQRRLLTGDVGGKIFVTTQGDGGKWSTQPSPFTGHRETVESLQWSPSEENVFASAGNDGCVKIWDLRKKSKKPALSVQASESDVNAISWSGHTTHLLASGHDDGSWAVWDLRSWKQDKTPNSSSVAWFSFHKEQITSLDWHPTDNSVVAAAAGDHTLTLWDLAVELDDAESQDTAGVQNIPPQLLFVHYMDQIKECRWHKQIPGALMATGGQGFNVIKTISV